MERDEQRQPLGRTLRSAWQLGAAYFRSEGRWQASGLLAVVVALNLAQVGTTLLFTRWQGAFYNALQDKDWNAFLGSLLWWTSTPADGYTLGFAPILGAFVLITVYELYLRQALQMRWRRWTTETCIREWLHEHTHFRMALTDIGTDNPDQRIAEDVRLYVDNTLLLGLGGIRAIATVLVFVVFLWHLSGPFEWMGVTIHGYLVWIALVYAGLGSWITHLVGRRLTPLHFKQQKAEADFRFGLMRLKENAEGIALHCGEGQQQRELSTRFAAVVDNWRLIMTVTRRLTFLTTTYAQVILIFPFLVVAPAYFAGRLQLGAIFQASNAFAQVQTALSWIVTGYADLTTWLATVDRLAGFQGSVARSQSMKPGTTIEPSPTGRLEVQDLTVSLPRGNGVLAGLELVVARGERVLIKGPVGAGKSVLLRAIAGIWPFGFGTIRSPQGRTLFMPQRPYVPAGTLKQIVCFPHEGSEFSDAAAVDALKDVGLEHLAGELHFTDAWERRLSGGELQRLVFARALLIRPDWLYLDEATSSLDLAAEVQVYSRLLERLPHITLVSVAHRPQVARFHCHIFHLEAGRLQSVPAFEIS